MNLTIEGLVNAVNEASAMVLLGRPFRALFFYLLTQGVAAGLT